MSNNKVEKNINILLIEDNQHDANTIKMMLKHLNFPFNFITYNVTSLAETKKIILNQKFDIVLLDLSLPDIENEKTFEEVQKIIPDIPIIVITGKNDEKLGIELVTKGAYNYLVKGQINSNILARSICYAIEKHIISDNEKKLLLDALRNSETRFEFIYKFSPVMMFSFDKNGNICDVNLKWLEKTGYTRDEVIGKPFNFLIKPFHEKVKNIGIPPQFLHEGQVNDYYCQYIKKDGTLMDVLINCNITFNVTGELFGIAVVLDITEQCKMEQELLNIHEKLEKLVNEKTNELLKINQQLHYEINEHKKTENELKKAKEYAELIYRIAPNAIFTVDSNCNITSWNDMACKITEYLPSEVLGKHYFYIFPNSNNKICNFKNIKNINECFKSGVEEVIQTRSKKIKTVLVNRVPLINTDGEIDGFIESFEDITERKKIESELKKLSYAVEQSPVSIIITDVNGIIEYVNPKFCQVTGYSKDEVIGKKPNILKSGYTLKETYKELWQTILNGNEWHGELHNRKKNGELFWEYVSISPIKDSNGNITHFLAVKEDITLRKKFEFELWNAKLQAELANRAKSEFLANISHEIRTPLNGIIGFIDVLLSTELSEEQLDYVKTIKNSSTTLLKLINDILDFSKIEAGKLELEEIDFDLEQLCYEVCEMISFVTLNKPIEILCDVCEGGLALYNGDVNKIRQILINLLGNAAKFTEQGEIILLVKEIESFDDKVKLYFMVKDTGVGISEDKLDIIFDAFKQADGSVTRKYGGSGLGLSICKKLINFLGGDIWVESQVGVGSKFHFTLIVNKYKGLEQKQDIEFKCFENKRIMIIDDNLASIELLSKMIRTFNMIPMGFQNYKDALRELELACENHYCYDLIILDISMPDIDGYEIAKMIKEFCNGCTKSIPILAFSTLFNKNIKKFVEYGFNGFLSKPIKKQTLINVLKRILIGANTTFTEPCLSNKSIDSIENYKFKILVAEDNPVNQKLALVLFKNEGYTIDIAENGEKAVELFKQSINSERYDIIFMDVQMPVMDGLTATKMIRKIESEYFNSMFFKTFNSSSQNIQVKKNIPIIAMTANATKEDILMCLNSGMNDYIAKPVNKELILNMIKKWVIYS